MSLNMLGARYIGSATSGETEAVVRQEIVNAMKKMEADRVFYRWGGHKPETGVDCAGAVMAAYIDAGVVPEKQRGKFAADDMERSFKSIWKMSLQPGDSVFYGKGKVTHVMLYCGDGIVCGATGGGPLTKTKIDAADRDARVKSEKIDYRSDVYGYGRAPIGETLENVAPSNTVWILYGIGVLGVAGAGLWFGGYRPATVIASAKVAWQKHKG